MNHERFSGNIVRLPRVVSCVLFVYQEWSRDRSAESTRVRCRFFPVLENFHGYTARLVRTSKIWLQKRAKCTEIQHILNDTEGSLSAWFTYLGQNRTTVLVLERGPVQVRTAKPLYDRLLILHWIQRYLSYTRTRIANLGKCNVSTYMSEWTCVYFCVCGASLSHAPPDWMFFLYRMQHHSVSCN